MQPTYLPWCGYFDMLDQADVFVLLDTVPVSPKSWQTRNRIRARDGNVVWLSVPTNARRGMLLNDVLAVDDWQWKKKQGRTIDSAYGHAPYGFWLSTEFELWHLCARARSNKLVDINAMTLDWLARRADIGTLIVRASTLDLPPRADPIHHIADICSAVGAHELLNTPGAKDFLEGHDIGVPVRWHDYEHPVYDQGGAEFVSHLSVVDLLAWHGPDSLRIIRSGRR